MVKQKEFEEIIEGLYPTINYSAFILFNKCGIEMEDSKQMLLERLWMAMKKKGNNFDPKKGSPKTFYNRVVINETTNIIKSKKEDERLLSLNDRPVEEEEHFTFLDCIEDKRVRFVYDLEKEHLIEKIIERLDVRSGNALHCILKCNFHLTKASKMLRTSRQNLNNIINRKIKPIIKMFTNTL